MSWIRRLFKRGDRQPSATSNAHANSPGATKRVAAGAIPTKKPRSSAPVQEFREADNLGTRHTTQAEADGYWTVRSSVSKQSPFLRYTFANRQDAMDALLAVPCMHLAKDSAEVICTDTLTYGYYRLGEQVMLGGQISQEHEAYIAGAEFSHKLWTFAQTSFSRKGQRKDEQEPPRRAAPAASKAKPAGPTGLGPGTVKFVKEERNSNFGVTATYRVHRGPDAASAKAFLKEHPVEKMYYHIVVETPEGTWCRDVNGIYKEGEL